MTIVHELTTLRGLQQLPREAVEDMAKTAFFNGEPLAAANRFPCGSFRYDWFALAYHEVERECMTAAPS